MKSPIPSGYFFGSRWFSSSCKTGNFFDAESINSCLKGKRIYFNGDSTMRQWIQYLNHFQKDFKSLDGSGFSSMMIANHHSNFTIEWKNHGHPWITVRRIKIAESRYISRDLDSIKVEGKEEQVVVVISVGQHFRAFPLELFVRRLLSLRRAIQRLQTRILGTQVFIKLENTREFSSEQERFSDWHGHLQNLAQKKVFGDLNVGFIDAWDMTVAANTFSIHPSEAIIANEMAVFLSYLCHAP
ncbi:NXPE family member 2-like isoform X1 [Arapaima gigas]